MHHQPGFSALREVGSRRGRVPNPRTPQHTETQLTKGAGPRAHSARGISWRGEGPSGPASRSPGTIGPGRGCAPPPGLRANSAFLPPLQLQSQGRPGGGVSKPGIQRWGQVQALHCQSFPSSQGLPGSNLFLRLACFVSLLQAGAGFGGVYNLQTGAAALLQTQRRPLPCKSRRGSWRCTRRRAGPRPRPDRNPPPLGPFLQVPLSSLPSFR